jgi:hypothetical protein
MAVTTLCVGLLLGAFGGRHVSAALGDCSSSNGWTMGHNAVFRITTNRYIQSDAVTQCQSLGASLATLEDSLNFQLAKEMAYNFSYNTTTIYRFWIGLQQDNNSLEPEYGWKWSNGPDFQFWNGSAAWAPGYPTNNGTGGRTQVFGCGAVKYDGIRDFNCSSLLYAICAKPGE